MDKFKTLEPLKLYSTSARKNSLAPHSQFVGKLPSDLHLLILSYLPIPDFSAYARCSHATAALAESEKLWETRLKSLGITSQDSKDGLGLDGVLNDLEAHSREKAAESRAAAPPTISVDDDFGDFAESVNVPPDEMGDFVGAFQTTASLWTNMNTFKSPLTTASSYRGQYIRAHSLLKPLTSTLSSSSPPHIILNSLSTAITRSAPSLRHEASTLRLLSLFLSLRIQPIRKWRECKTALRSAMDRFDAGLLAAFDQADERGDEAGMREASEASWLVSDGNESDWELSKVWAEKREIFYDQPWDPLTNFTSDNRLAFDAMDDFMESHVLPAVSSHGLRALRAFPPQARLRVLYSFADRVASDVVGEYIQSVLTRAREISVDAYLKATAASFREAWKMVDVITGVVAGAEKKEDPTSESTSRARARAGDVVYHMFEPNMDEYLDEEADAIKPAFEGVCKGWDRRLTTEHASQHNFLSSQNPSQVKRNVLASFADVLLLPVTIVPKIGGAVGGALVSGGTAVGGAAAQGIAMLNPQRWGGSTNNVPEGYRRHGDDDNDMMFEIGSDDEDENEKDAPKATHLQLNDWGNSEKDVPAAPNSATTAALNQLEQLDTLLSLDVALELIQISREALKRLQTFIGYSDHAGENDKGRIGTRVQDTIEEIFILMLQALGEGHIRAGFSRATERMTTYNPSEHSSDQGGVAVAPLLQFFELVHIGDTIQSMVQVYFDKEMAPHISTHDFLNTVLREKKRFENALDDSVAGGLNAGTSVLMSQVEHIILTYTKPREYYPPENVKVEELDLTQPTKGCMEAIRCLEVHCRLVKGSTSREVLEVFYEEVGLRLISILQKHIKRQIISLSGGFLVIADLNAYHTFITRTLKVPSTSRIAGDFANLKMLGHVYVVEDAKDLAQIVRDVTRYGGAYRPEDIYEFIQRRSDWKKIEKTVDKTMYNLSFKEDCVVF
ncbi:exocyst complex component Sec10-like protein [Rhodocollybia butyracea]|uniref:Exocyst complex component Sec10-like protein n=1 Tax=Rhodocollybia butyracea TaxID=206335 RepID=A0A9P5QBQ0_9AGAR|nr:exocyst complex component Sec10-like protein [Rhodocollybia butyracea]